MRETFATGAAFVGDVSVSNPRIGRQAANMSDAGNGEELFGQAGAGCEALSTEHAVRMIGNLEGDDDEVLGDKEILDFFGT